MSSILRALKKIEDEDTRQREGLLRNKPFWQGLYDKRNPSGRSIVLSPWGIITVCSILFCSWQIGEYLRNRNNGASLPVSLQTRKPYRQAANELIHPQAVREQEKQTEQSTKPLSPQHLPPQMGKFISVPNQLPPSAHPVFLKKAKTQPPSKEETTPLKEAAPQTHSLKLIDPTELKLQAITWDSNPEFRFAVLNDRIVHVGETVDGYLIHSIDQDSVTVKKNDIHGKVLFRTRRESVAE